MAESIAQPDTEDTEGSDKQVVNATQHAVGNPEATATVAAVIWTPYFIVVFALILVLGLSLESILTQAWTNHFINALWVILAHMACIVGCVLALIVTTRSWWIRIGGIFACIWGVFAIFNQFLGLSTLTPTSPVLAYVNAAICSALLGSYICFSLERTSHTAWDTWFFRIALIISICVVGTIFLVTLATQGPLSTIESGIAALGLVFAVLVWWLRPSCWQTQAGPTFLFGLTPTITLLLTLTGLGHGSTNFFLSQVALLTFLLAIIRTLQGELLYKKGA
ncbi:MAG TPA: hypothetical protein VEU97_03705 [Ktedonobacteraceae bacterium]|nr:hypothetical protein [Ktedonobacteraceae bacterium]